MAARGTRGVSGAEAQLSCRNVSTHISSSSLLSLLLAPGQRLLEFRHAAFRASILPQPPPRGSPANGKILSRVQWVLRGTGESNGQAGASAELSGSVQGSLLGAGGGDDGSFHAMKGRAAAEREGAAVRGKVRTYA